MPAPSLIGHYAACRKFLCEAAKRRQKVQYKELQGALGLPSPQQNWKTVLNPIADDEVRNTGHDLTLIVVYSTGPARGLSRYFSNIRGGQPAGSTLLDPKNPQQVAAYEQALQQVFNRYATVQC
jgi:hypothetical protein